MLAAILFTLAAAAAPLHSWNASGEAIEGAALASPAKLVTWGRRLIEWNATTGHRRILATGPFLGGGCWTGEGIVLAEPSGRLSLRRAPKWEPRQIDTGVQLGDCLWTTILGHRGLLMIQRGAQIRFYEPPAPDEHNLLLRWPYREIYSIYTPSYQGGLILSDVNNDSLPDLYCGNYWLRSPEQFDLPWRLFAINVLHKSERASNFRLILTPDGLIASQGDLDVLPHLSLFTRPEGPDQITQFWTERPLADGLNLKRPKAVAFDGNYLLVGENAGDQSRVFLFDSGHDWKPRQIGRTTGLHTAIALEPGVFLAAGADRIYRVRIP